MAPRTNKEKRTFEKGVDMDSALIGIEQGFSRYMLNCLIDNGVDVTNIKGNLLAAFEDGFTFFKDNPDYNYRCIGSKYDPVYQKTYFFVIAQTLGTSPVYYSFIFEYDIASNIVYVVCGDNWSSILDFDFDELITGIYVVFINTTTPLLYWSQRAGLRKINVYKAKLLYSSGGADPDGYSTQSLQIVDRIKYQPYFAPTIAQITDKDVFTNSIQRQFFQFSYRYIYDDLEKSATSEWSDINVPYFENSITPYGTSNFLLYKSQQLNNLIQITLNTGFETVTKVQILVRKKVSDAGTEVNGSWYIYDTLNKAELGYTNNQDVVYNFYNDKVGQLITQEEANRSYDNVPLRAESDTIGEDLRSYQGNITEGFDLTPIDADVRFKQENSQTIESIWAAENVGGYLRGVVKLPTTSIFSVGDTIWVSFLSATYASYTYQYMIGEGDLDNYPTSLVSAFQADFDTYNPVPEINFANGLTAYSFYLEDGLPVSGVNEQISSAYNSFSSRYIKKDFKNYADQFLGIFYFDSAGRRSPIQPIPNVKTKVDSQIGRIYAEIDIYNVPPVWAMYWGIASGGDSLGNIYSIDMDGVVKNADTSFTGNSNYFQTYDGKDYTFITYEFTPGDRIRIVTASGAVDLAIIKATATTVTFEYDNFVNIDVVGGTTIFGATIYKPRVFNEFYYTIYKGTIGDAGLSTRYHEGNLQNQSYSSSVTPAISEFYGPCCYWRTRFGAYVVEDRNQSDFYESAVTDFGKPSIENENFMQITRPATITLSQQFIPEANVNGLSSYPDGSFKDYDSRWGGIYKLFSSDRALKVFQEIRCGWIPIKQQVNAGGAEQTFNLNTSDVLTEIIYYEALRGIGRHPESHAHFGTSDYFVDPLTGSINRISRDGLTVLTDVRNEQGNYLVRQSLYDAIKANDGNFPGGFNERRNCYEVNLGGIVMVWDEQKNSWVGGRSYDAEFFGNAGVDLVSFYNGQLYLHEANELRNNFYNVQHSSKLWVPGNWMDFKKIYKAITLRSETIWSAYEILNDVGQLSIIDKLRFSKRENMWYAAFRRDMNTVNVRNPIVDGKQMRDTVILIKLENNSVEYEWINFILINQIESR